MLTGTGRPPKAHGAATTPAGVRVDGVVCGPFRLELSRHLVNREWDQLDHPFVSTGVRILAGHFFQLAVRKHYLKRRI